MTPHHLLRAAILASSLGLFAPGRAVAATPDAPADSSLSRAIATDPSSSTRATSTAPAPGSRATSTAVAPDRGDSAVLDQPAIDDIPLQMNSETLRYIEFFTGSGRSTFERWLKRSGRYMELFRNVLQREGLPPDLVHLVFVESGFNLQARSYASAVGPWQFLKGTSRLFGLNVDQWVDERKDPEKATVAAARYLKHLYGIFNDWPLALASYNAGEGRVLRAIKSQGTTNYWDLKLPTQTEEYVPKFMAALAISQDPRKYGFDDVELDDPMQFDEVSFKGAVDLRSVAKLAECTVDELRQLNPAVLGTTARGANGVTTLRVPDGRSEIILQKLSDGTPLPAVDVSVQHRVRKGETVKSIARRFKVSATTLANANGITKKRPLRRGMLLSVPVTARPATPQLLADDDPLASTAYVPERRIGKPAVIMGNSEADDRHVHRVQRGETIEMIAANYNVTTTDLQRWNGLSSSRVRPGQRLKVRTGEAAIEDVFEATADSAMIATLTPPRSAKTSSVAKSAKKAAYRTVTVRRGDTLSEIADRHNVSAAEIKRLNKLRSSTVKLGQRLRLPA